MSGREPAERVSHRLERLVVADDTGRGEPARMQQSQSCGEAAFGLPPFPRLVVSQKVKMGDADGHDEVNGVVAVSPADDIGKNRWAADRIGYDEQSLRPVASHGWQERRDTQPWHN